GHHARGDRRPANCRNAAAPYGHARRIRQRRGVSLLACRGLCAWRDGPGRRRLDPRQSLAHTPMPSAPPVPSISLLWPPGAGVHAPDTPRLSARAAADLDLETTVRALSASPGDQRIVTAALSTLCADPDVIAYRQAVLEDLLNAPELLARLEALLPAISAVERFRYASRPGQTPLHEVVWRVGQLESYVECVRGLMAAFEGQAARVNSDALRRLCDEAARAAQDPLFAQLERDLPAMTKAVRSVASITIGVNLDDQLRPVGATLIDIHDRPFRGETPSLFGALFRGQQDGLSSIGPLHSVP